MNENTKVREPVNSTSTTNANKLYNTLSESDKALITAMLNTAFVLFRGVQQVQTQKNTT